MFKHINQNTDTAACRRRFRRCNKQCGAKYASVKFNGPPLFGCLHRGRRCIRIDFCPFMDRNYATTAENAKILAPRTLKTPSRADSRCTPCWFATFPSVHVSTYIHPLDRYLTVQFLVQLHCTCSKPSPVSR